MILYLTIEQVLKFHDELIQRFGGLAGIRDEGLLYSSLDAPKAAFSGTDMYPSVLGKAAVYLFHLIKNHPFNDGNKRTAFVATLAFLKANQTELSCEPEDLENMIMAIAAGQVGKNTVIQFLNTGKLPIHLQREPVFPS